MTKTAELQQKGVNTDEDKDVLWINPTGGYGDVLMMLGVLKLAHEQNPAQRYKLVRRTKYTDLFTGHPAIEAIGYPPKDANFVDTAYWTHPEFETGQHRAFQLLAQRFKLETPVEEKLFLPGGFTEDPLLDKLIPWKKKNVVIAPSSDSPRKIMHPMAWHNIVERLTAEGVLVIQVGNMRDIHIKGAYSLLNLTTPRQLISLLKKCNFVVTSDNFIMHAAHLVEKQAVVMWGPTSNKVYGYAEQQHLQASLDHCPHKNECLGPRFPQNYTTVCPLGQEHCMNKIPLDKIINTIFTLL